MLCSSNSFLNLNPIVSSSINKPLVFRSLRIIKFTVSAKMEQNDAAAAAPPFTFLTRKPYTPPSWASHLKPLPSHAFSLGHLPTPIHKWNLPNLPNNTEVWLKRDDLSGMQLSGNKVRKLEFLMADAMAQGADCIITIGGIQSNHCRATAVAAKYLNLDCYLILRTSKILVDEDPGLIGNLLVERLVGAHIELISKEEYSKIGSVTLTDILKEKLLKEGRRPYVIPVGGSNSLGTWGYIEAIREIEQQLQTVHNKLKFDDIVVACGSGGTIAGLSLGSWLGTLKAKVHAFSVCDDPDYFYDFTQGLLDGLNAGVNSRDIVNVQNAKGLGYAITTSEELKFVKEIAAATGVVLDPVYSGKAAYGMLKDMAENPKKWEGRKILFIHTGGLLGLFDKVDQMAPLVTNWSRMDVHESVPREDGHEASLLLLQRTDSKVLDFDRWITGQAPVDSVQNFTIMAAANDPEHLPAGWTLHLKVQKTGRKIRYYKNLVTGKRFFYKDDLLQYVGMESTQGNKPQPTNSPSKRRSEYSGTKHIPKENESSEWLPDGWIMELRTRKSGSSIGRPYKVFIDPLTGCKFLSKPGVLRYLESVKQKKRASKQEKTSTGTRSSSKAAVRSTVNDLPPGWIKETRTRKTACGIKNDPYYTDPVSGIIFRSKKDVLRYLETGEISRYAFKLAKSGIDDKTLTSTAAKRQKMKQTVTSRRLFEGKASLNERGSALPAAEAFKKRRSKRLSGEIDLNGAPTAEVFAEKMMIQKGSGTKEITSLGCSSLSKSTGSKSKKILADSLPVPTPSNCLQGQNLLERGMECSSRKSLNNSSISKNKKKLNLPRRSSKRLAGHEPELVVNWDSTKCSPKIATTKSRKSEAIPAGGLTSDGLSDKASEPLKVEPVKEHTNCMSFEQNLQSHGEACKNLGIPGEQPQKFDSAKTDDGNSEPCPFIPIGNSNLDPCLEFAFKTLTGEIPVDGISNNRPVSTTAVGEIPVDGISNNRPVSTPAVDVPQDKILQENEIGKSSNRKTRIKSIKSKNKQELNLPRRSSKRLSGLEPELVSNLMFNEQSCGNVTRNSSRCEATTGLADGVSQQLGDLHETTGVEQHDSTGIKCQSHGESSNKNQRDLEVKTVFEGEPQKLEIEKMDIGKPEDQPQNLETEKMNNENAESQFFPFGESWPDPCLEFAYKTLTGAIPVEDDLTFQDYIQNQRVQVDGASGLPDLGMPSYFESDILFQFDAQEKPPASQQQFSVNQSLLPSGSASSPRCSSIASQQPCLEGNKGFHGKVKS